MSASDTASELLTYMSQKLLDVAEMNTVLDTFGSSKALPAASKPTIEFVKYAPFAEGEASWRYSYQTVTTNSDWIRIRGADAPYSTYVINPEDFGNFGGFDFGPEPEAAPLETRALTAADRAELLALEMF